MLTPEDQARENIDHLQTQAGWAVRNQSDANILAYRGVAIRNFTLKQGTGLPIIFSMGMAEPRASRFNLANSKKQASRNTRDLLLPR